MSNGYFIKHESCDKCGSSDARGVYSDGGWFCFSCKDYERGMGINSAEIKTTKHNKPKEIPSGTGFEYGTEAIEWTGRYGISIQDLLREKISYYKPSKRLFFIWYGENKKEILGWQSRNFQEGWPKYLSSGNLNVVFPIYRGNREGNRVLVLTEDCLSSIKVRNVTEEALESSTIDAMPCLTSSLPISKLNRLVKLYDTFLIWLDSDMFHNAQKMVRQLQAMGAKARAIYTDEDPKCYQSQQILDILASHPV